MNLLIILLLLFSIYSCNSTNEVKISADVKTINANPNSPDNNDVNTPTEETNSQTTTNLLLEEDFEYTLSDNTTINSDFLNDATFTSKWDVYNIYGTTHNLATSNGSIKWNAYYAPAHWGAGLITKQKFNFPITIQYDLDHSSYYSGASAFDGVCIYDDTFNSSAQRNMYYGNPEGLATNYGCILFNQTSSISALNVAGVFLDASDTSLFQAYYFWYFHYISGLTRINRITININADLSYEVTVYDNLNAFINYSSTLKNSLSNVRVEFFTSDFTNYRAYFDNIKIWNGNVAASSF